jgi:hypothetical protein
MFCLLVYFPAQLTVNTNQLLAVGEDPGLCSGWSSCLRDQTVRSDASVREHLAKPLSLRIISDDTGKLNSTAV